MFVCVNSHAPRISKLKNGWTKVVRIGAVRDLVVVAFSSNGSLVVAFSLTWQCDDLKRC